MKRAIASLAMITAMNAMLLNPALAEAAKAPVAASPAAPPGNAARTNREQRAAEILHQMLPPDVAAAMAAKKTTGRFGGEMTRLATENAYEQLWTRPGLSLRDRSMVTIAMLIAIGNERELKVHIRSGLRNGVTPQEIEEMIYQATAYVGFPRASDALAAASAVIAEQARGK
jgi:4-carboxymuconolactone decarboxylase